MRRVAILAPLAALCLTTAAAHAQAPAKTAPAQPAFALPSLDTKFTGDLDGMIKRRLIRILAPYSKTFYLLERDLNRRLKTGNVRVHVAIIPMAQDQFMAALRDGRGDIAMGNLAITPERSKLVDFSDPAMKNVSEIVVTGPGAPAIRAVDDLAGTEVFIRKSSSVHESLQALNADFARRGKPTVRIRPAPEHLETEDILEMVSAGLVKITIADDYLAAFWSQVFPKLTDHPDAAIRTG